MTDQLRHHQTDRHETMLEELIVTMRRHHRRRRMLRSAAAWGLFLAVAGGTLVVGAQRAGLPARFAERGPAPRQVEPAAPQIVLVGRNHRTGLVRVIDDDELVQRLVEIDRPSGLIRADGKAWLTSAVADTEIEPLDEPEPPL